LRATRKDTSGFAERRWARLTRRELRVQALRAREVSRSERIDRGPLETFAYLQRRNFTWVEGWLSWSRCGLNLYTRLGHNGRRRVCVLDRLRVGP
jgi:hypothetical protein